MTSLVSEYRRLAAASLDLAKRAAAFGDKTRLLVIAEAWLDLADRVAKKTAPAQHRTGGSIEYFKSAERPNVNTFGSDARGADNSTPACK